MFNLSGTKQLKLDDGSSINYELIKKNRRTISLKITPKGLVVNAPILMANSKIDQLLQKKSQWIQKKLLLTSYNEEPFEMQNGVKFKILDKELVVTLKVGVNNISIEGSRCFISFKSLSDPFKLKKNFLIWIKMGELGCVIHMVQRLN